ncbi:MAG: hypothetical protein ACRBBP_08355 [Bdellovibrionales bacterium]
MNLLKSLLFALIFFPIASFAQHPDISKFNSLFKGQLYAGFGLARDLVSHVYQGKPFNPRDYDFAVVGTGWSEEKAEQVLSRYGTIVRKLRVGKEVLKPSGRVFSYEYGFVIILEYKGEQLDFKFFDTLEDAHIRGLYDVEKILFPLNERSIDQLVADTHQIKSRSRLPEGREVSDPHKGIESTLAERPLTVNWGRATAAPIDWAVRGAMIYAKLGKNDFPHAEKQKMIQMLHSVQFMLPSDYAIIRRAIKHKSSSRVKELLDSIGFFEKYQKWRWNEPISGEIKSWLEGRLSPLYCKGLL